MTAFSNRDPITRGGDRVWQDGVPGCAGQPHTILKNGGHFLQEDSPDALSREIITFMQEN